MKESEQKIFAAGAVELRRGKYPGGQSKLSGLMECPDCKKQHWTDSHIIRKATFTGLCRPCCAKKNVILAHRPECRPRGIRNHRFKRGYWITKAGYVELILSRIDPRSIFIKRGGGKIFEHRMVMSQHLGRRLESWEHVHHRNGIKTDNNIENLELVTAGLHAAITQLTAEIRRLKAEILRLTTVAT